MKVKLITLLSLCSLFLSSCVGGSSSPNVDSALDDKIFSDAISNLDVDNCANINEAGKSEDCVSVIESLMIMENAVITHDLSLCDSIVQERYKEDCIYTVNNNLSVQQLIDNRDEQTSMAIENLDPSLCEDISDSNFKDECLVSVFTHESNISLDQSVCDQINNESLKNDCINDSRWLENQDL